MIAVLIQQRSKDYRERLDRAIQIGKALLIYSQQVFAPILMITIIHYITVYKRPVSHCAIALNKLITYVSSFVNYFWVLQRDIYCHFRLRSTKREWLFLSSSQLIFPSKSSSVLHPCFILPVEFYQKYATYLIIQSSTD